MSYPKRVEIVEVGTRDGLQNEKGEFTTEDKIALVEALADTGIPCLEVTSMVSPRVVPQMADAEAVLQRIRRLPGTVYRVLVPNLKGTERALANNVDELCYAVVATETYSHNNWNMSIAETLKQIRLSIERIRQEPRPLRVVVGISVAFGCPFEGDVPDSRILQIAGRLVEIGADEVSLNDSTGMGNPRQVERIVALVRELHPNLPLSLHLHNTRGTGLANLVAALRQGVSRFDASIGGLGGCPFAPFATGNIATEDTVHMLHEMGIETGIDLDKLLEVTALAQRIVQHPLPGLVHKAGKRSDLSGGRCGLG